ncbi:Ktr system potassium transporter B [Mesobaculum littorinae]|uniref:Ktr system potassium transporter B n=1 Tax=Mesobaculum littorinae TaxID=2486419 RepID=A0A438AIK2_9RHOB|nr:potassium transporter TrkG [Mesobaculum littorinae]RVV98484.1 Ktr system potassium transporter B [Mesobaculum littorinae]
MSLPLLRGRLRPRTWTHLLNLPPPALLALLYAGLIVTGAVALMLPLCNTGTIGFFDAIFTSTSAVTVTGLVVFDIGTELTPLGQGVIALLIQMGGLGLMTFAVLILMALGLPVGMPQRVILREDLEQTSLTDLTVLVRLILKAALICEGGGAIVMAMLFVPELGWAEGLWAAVFHTISAFNNAGFALWPDSLSRWVGHPVVVFAVPAMFVIGGLGFVVLADLFEARTWRRLTLHTKLTLVGTVALGLLGIVGFGLLEWRNPATLGGLEGVWPRVGGAIFQGLTPRTAGFNTVDISGIHDSTALMMISLMLVGGGAASTAGGIKVTSAIVLLLATIAFFRRRQTLHAFGRSLGVEEVMKCMALTTVSMLVVMMGIFLVSLSHDGNFLDYVFEVASAFGTTGLSRGATGDLDALGRLTIMGIMFLGRVGPLTLGFFLATQHRPRIGYPSGKVYLG